ncbi:MAG: Uncharacterised protein [Rhodospirillaceae bacterium]|nr:MAG: Uncharacterised protein [Rhodospirillaceae bacterium]
MAAVAGQALDRLGHKGRPVAVLFGNGLDHEFEERVLVGRAQRVVELPVHLKLAVGVLVVVLVRPPAQLQHIVADLGDDIVAAHHRLLVVAGLFGAVVGVGNLGSLRRKQEEFGLHPGFDAQAIGLGAGKQAVEYVARGLLHQFVFHHQISGDPGDFALPRQLDHRGRVRHGEHVGVRRGHIQPAGEPGEACAFFLHVRDGLRGHQFGPLRTEQIGERDHEVLNAFFFGEGREVGGHVTLRKSDGCRGL